MKMNRTKWIILFVMIAGQCKWVRCEPNVLIQMKVGCRLVGRIRGKRPGIHH